MSIEALAAARKVTGVTATEKSVLMALADYANDEWEAYPSQTTLAEWTCLTRKTIGITLQRLEARGLLTSRHQYRDDGGYRVKLYRLNPTVLAATRAVPKTEPKPGALEEPPAEPQVEDATSEGGMPPTVTGGCYPGLQGGATQGSRGVLPRVTSRTAIKNSYKEQDKHTRLPSRSELEGLLEIWNEERGNLPRATALSRYREAGLRRLARTAGGLEAAVEMLRAAARAVAADPWWNGQNPNRKLYGLDNLLASDKFVARSEETQARQDPAAPPDPLQAYRDLGL